MIAYIANELLLLYIANITKNTIGTVNNGSITDIVLNAILESANGQSNCVPYVVSESIIP